MEEFEFMPTDFKRYDTLEKALDDSKVLEYIDNLDWIGLSKVVTFELFIDIFHRLVNLDYKVSNLFDRMTHLNHVYFSRTKIKSLDLTKSNIVDIDFCAFDKCVELEHIGLPSTLKSIGKYAFVYCRSLTTIDLPTGLEEIGEYAFSNCVQLKSITIPPFIETINQYSFYHCVSLTSVVVLGDELTFIEAGAFKACDNLTQVQLPASLISISNGAFSGTHLQEITFKGTIKQWKAIKKDPEWKGYKHGPIIIHCSDGDYKNV